jgi:hypothetical protein
MGYTISTVTSWAIAMTKESAIDMIAASEAVTAIIPIPFAKPPSSIIAYMMLVKGLATLAPSSIITPTVPMMTPVGIVNQFATAITAYPVFKQLWDEDQV